MKYIKKILFICLIFSTVGCSVNYKLDIKEDLSVSEKVVASEKTTKLQSLTRKKSKQAVDYLFQMYKRKNENISISSVDKDDETIATCFTNHSNIEEYSKKFTSDIFEKVIVEKNDNKVRITANQNKFLSKDSSYSLIYDDITINIYVPFKVTNNNADRISGNTYTWYIKKDGKLNNIEIEYEEGNYKDNINVKINNKIYNINYFLITILSIVTIIIFIVLFVYFNNKKNNII